MGNTVLGIDGESVSGEYKLIGSNVHRIVDRDALGSAVCFEFLLDQAATCNRMFGYGIGYDVSHWIKDLTHSQKVRLAKTGMVYTELGLRFYRVSYRPNIYFRVDRLKGCPTSKGGKETMQSALVVDLMRWHRKPFSDVADEWGLVDSIDREIVRHYKAARADFTDEILPAIERYNSKECDMIAELGEEMQASLRQLDLPVSYPLTIGAVAGQLAHRNKVQQYRPDQPNSDITPILPYAFHGGRMQVCRFGQFEDVRHYDIRSAYGWAMAQLPDLNGLWQPVEAFRLNKWGLYFVKWNIDEGQHCVMPFPHRDANGYVHYPPRGCGWYWSPLIKTAMDNYPVGTIEVVHGYCYTPMDEVKPFGYMEELHATRTALAGEPCAGMLKLLMVATWGRMCSSGGRRYDKSRPGKNGTRGMLDWAGMTTALIQARLLDAIHWTGTNSFISCCVDGFFTTSKVPIIPRNDLGDWTAEQIDELFLVRPSFYWKSSDGWLDCKTSGIGTNSDTLDEVKAEWTRRNWRGAVMVTQRTCKGLLQCANEGDFTKLGEFENIKQVISLNPGMGKYGHTCPSVMVNNGKWERWLPYWPPSPDGSTLSSEFKSRMDRTIPEEVAGEAIDEVSEG